MIKPTNICSLSPNQNSWTLSTDSKNLASRVLKTRCSSRDTNYVLVPDENDNKNSVLELDFWNHAKEQIDCLQIIEEAKELLQRRLTHSVTAEIAIKSRKSKTKLLKNSESPGFKRFAMKSSEGSRFKENSKFFKLYEQDLSKIFLNKEKELVNIKEKRIALRVQILELRASLKIALTDHENYKKNLESVAKSRSPSKLLQTNEIAKYFSRRSSIREEISKKEAIFEETSKGIGLEIFNKNKLLESLDAQVSDLKKQLETVRQEKIKHYKSLLLDGKDTRSEGLSWIIKKLWKLNYSLKKSNFPSLLDEKSVSTLMVIANKSKELESLLEKLFESFTQKTNKNSTKKDKWNGIHTRLAQAANVLRTKKKETGYKSEKKTVSWVSCSPSSENLKKKLENGELQDIDTKIIGLRKEIQSIKDFEIKRLYKEYFLSTQKKFDLKALFAAVVGIENIERYSCLLLKQNKTEQN